MKRRNKMVAVLLSASITVMALSGCGAKDKAPADTSNSNSQNTSASDTAQGNTSTDTAQNDASADTAADVDTSEHVVLTMYCIGDEGGIYAAQHIEEINKLLTEKINAELNPVMVSWGDYKSKLPMVWAGGEAYDLTYTSSWTGYFTEGARGAYMDITELFPQYAPQTYALFEENGYLDSVKINDRIYMVPNDKPDFTSFIYNYREDLRKKYNCPEIVDDATLKTYLDAIKANEPAMTPYFNHAMDVTVYQLFLNEQNWSRPVDSSAGIFVYDLDDPTKVFDVTKTEEYKAFIERSREFYNNGYWSQSIMAETAAPKDMFEGGQSALYLGNISNSNTVYMNITAQHPDWEIGYYSSDLLSGEVELVSPSNNGMAVGAYSKNPERALMFIELMYNDQEVFDLVMNGLEGITYEKDEATMTKWVPEGTDPGDVALKNLGMGFSTQKFELGSKNDSPTVLELKEKFGEVSVFPELAGFAVNQDAVSAELAAVKSVLDEYKMPLDKGVNDPVKGLEELQSKLQAAGADKLLEEINNQIAAYLAE